MDDSNSESPAPLTAPSVASILGVKGPLRFRRHGASQKAHVVLRRVELSEDSSYPPGTRPVVHFSLFAAKRIEVKPGKEILLSVASEDGSFTEQAVIFEGDLSTIADSNSDEEEEVEKQIAQDDTLSDSPSSHVIPPKMRRTWTKHYEQVSSVEDTSLPPQPPPPTHVSVGVQAQPTWSVSSVQAVPPTPPIKVLPLSPIHQTPEAPSTPMKEPSHLPEAEPESSPKLIPPPDDHPIPVDDRSRSLSPMSIGSPPSTPPQSPSPNRITSPINVPVTPTKPTPVTLVQPSSTASTTVQQTPAEKPEASWMHIEDAASRTSQISPVSSETVDMDLQSSPSSRSSASDDDIPGFITGAASRRGRPPSPLVLPMASIQFSIPTQLSVVPSSHSMVASPSSTIATSVAPFTVEPMPEKHEFSPPASATAPPPPPKRALVKNPFVSGGFITEFVGEKDSLTSKKGSTDSLSPYDKPESLFEQVCVKSEPAVPQEPSSPKSSSLGLQSLKVIVPDNKAPLGPPSIQSPAFASTPYQTLPQQTLSSLPPRTSENAFSYPTSTHAKQGYQPITSGNDPRLTYSSTGSVSNPLNIRPSRLPPPIPPKSVVQPTSPVPASKRKVVVGNGWPYTKQTNGHAAPAVPSMSVSPPMVMHAPPIVRPLTPESTRSSTTPPGLSGLAPYSSPSPPGFLHSSSGLNYKTPSSADPSGFGLFSQPLSSTPQIKHEINEWGSPALSRSTKSPVSANTQNIPIQAPRPLPPPSAASTVLQYTPQPYGHPASNASTPSIDSKGKKRALTSDADVENTRPRKRPSAWPSHDPLFSIHIKSDEDPGINHIAFSSDGERLAVICNDRTIRIWNMLNKVETARLTQNAPIMAVAWMSDDMGVVSLGQDGLVSKWTRTNQNHWQWAKLLDAGKEDSVCFAYQRDRIAIAFPRIGVKVWIWIKGTWQPQRSILRQNVTSIQFVEDGEALIGGTSDGVLWYCQVPNGTLRAYAFLKAKVYHLDVNAPGTHALVSQVGGRAHLVGIQQTDHKGKIEQVYSTNGDSSGEQRQNFGAVFASGCKTVLFGCTESHLMVWDRSRGEVICGLDHGDYEQVQAIASFDRGANAYIVTGTKGGLLCWWKPPLTES